MASTPTTSICYALAAFSFGPVVEPRRPLVAAPVDVVTTAASRPEKIGLAGADRIV